MLISETGHQVDQSSRESRRRREASELALKDFGETDRRTILKIRSDDLDTDWQTGFRTIDCASGPRTGRSASALILSVVGTVNPRKGTRP